MLLLLSTNPKRRLKLPMLQSILLTLAGFLRTLWPLGLKPIGKFLKMGHKYIINYCLALCVSAIYTQELRSSVCYVHHNEGTCHSVHQCSSLMSSFFFNSWQLSSMSRGNIHWQYKNNIEYHHNYPLNSVSETRRLNSAACFQVPFAFNMQVSMSAVNDSLHTTLRQG